MTPEEAKPRDGYAGQYSDASEKWFTAKETAEIAISYAYDERRFQSSMSEQAEARYMAWRDKFEEWSK